MNRIFLLVFILTIAGLNSCKTGNGSDSQSSKIISKTKAIPSAAITDLRNRALAVYDFRMKNGKENTAQIVDYGVWEYRFTFADGAMSKRGELAGKWIDFHPDNTYEYGYYSEVKGNGIYHYDMNSTVALLIDNDPTIKPQEFEMKISMDALVMAGMHTYNDKSTQSKLQNLESRPSQ